MFQQRVCKRIATPKENWGTSSCSVKSLISLKPFFIPSIELSKKIQQTQFEIDSFYGLYNDENNIEDKMNFYKDIIPVDLIPIGDLPGGDLVCLGTKDDKQNKIYFWFHEKDEKNVHLVSDSFKNFIMNFKSINVEKNILDDVELNISNKLNTFLINASKNFKK